ncbi:hypothetical protein [Aquamicrobium soli]|uniref:Uncharacterized protein n=1 Tax=Aquamicrobium soli TaxID=1811518 RepID=A0ABV7KI63_9HYPH
MTIKSLAIIVVAALCFATLMLFLLVGRGGRDGTRAGTKATTAVAMFSGKLDIRTMADFRVAGRRVMLCGVSFSKPASMEPLVREQARSSFQNSEVDCVQVGGGTPCDGRSAPVFEGGPVVQCRGSDGSDIAQVLSESGYLCDVPAQSGGAYKAC